MLNFSSSNNSREKLFHSALAGLQANCRPVVGSDSPVLNEGGYYAGIWMECAPHEGLVFAPVSAEVARLNHTSFFREQFSDGQIPPYLWADKAGTGQIQQTVPIVETAYELAVMTGDDALLRESYEAWKKWDAWLVRHRDTRKLNVCEAFCEYDTGHDNSSRFLNISRQCPGNDAKNCLNEPGMPRIAPDLTATLYGGRVTMAKIAALLNLEEEEKYWRDAAEKTRQALIKYCYDPESLFFYDRDCDGNLVKVVSDAGLRVFMEHVPDQEMFEKIFARWISNKEAFWTPVPLPSVAACDPGFIYPPQENCWGGACQALLALRTPRWLEHYGKFAALDELMTRYLDAFEKAGVFKQQLDPYTGEITAGTGEYSPAMCCVVDFISRIYGILQMPEEISWGCGAEDSRFELDLYRNRGKAEIRHRAGVSVLSINSQELYEISGRVRLFTDNSGKLLRMTAIADGKVTLKTQQSPVQTFELKADETVNF